MTEHEAINNISNIANMFKEYYDRDGIISNNESESTKHYTATISYGDYLLLQASLKELKKRDNNEQMFAFSNRNY